MVALVIAAAPKGDPVRRPNRSRELDIDAACTWSYNSSVPGGHCSPTWTAPKSSVAVGNQSGDVQRSPPRPPHVLSSCSGTFGARS